MKKFVAASFAFLFSTLVLGQAKYVPGMYNIDASHSKVGFEISHLVISSVEGRFANFDGTINMTDKMETSKVNASVDVASLDTDSDKRDEHLKSPDFFDVKKYPKMTFETTSVTGTPETFKMMGNLTIHGVTKPVTFDGKYLGAIKDMTGNNRVAFAANTKVSRKDFGLTWNKAIEAGPIVGDEVSIMLKVEAQMPEAPKKMN